MISQNKLKHTISVARKCKQIAKNKHLSEELQDACFVMGFLHDIGYEKCDEKNISHHPIDSYNMILNFLQHKDEILSAIYSHGTKYDNLTIFDEILNTADLTTSYDGTDVSIEHRLNAIKTRHGETSTHYQHAMQQSNALLHKRKE